ncbi:hypothetical protein SDC9_207311 [bioreactor metagenome]|uniref:Uncharacterized protein n=1 Tax=bioreactor metagenome TaxID=1076179 RepID=A0A645J8X0_9ZZZZ
MGCKECFCPRLRVLVYIFHDGPGNGYTVVGTCTSPQFIKEYQATVRQVVQDIGSLVHLYHKSGFPERDIVGCSHSGEYLVYQSDLCRVGGHETADLCHQGDQCDLT